MLTSRYYHGPTPIQSLQYATSQDIINSFQSIRQEMEAYTPNLTQVGDFYCLKARILAAATSDYKHNRSELCNRTFVYLFVFLLGCMRRFSVRKLSGPDGIHL